MSHDLRQHKCTFTACKIANPYIFAQNVIKHCAKCVYYQNKFVFLHI